MLPSANTLALEHLGWRSFQDLALTVCEELFGTPVQQFAPVMDLGQDGLVELPHWNPDGPHRTVIQAKHSSRPGQSLTFSLVAPEIGKIAQLCASEKIDQYCLVTNATVTAPLRAKIVSAFRDIGIPEIFVLERNGLERQIRENAVLRAKVPRLYGVGDLSSILDERRIAQSRLILEGIAADLITFVPTSSYRLAVDTLNEQKMVVLLGDPASGKTTIANCLIVGAIDQTAAEPVLIKSFSDIRYFWNANTSPRVFYFDDFLGAWMLDWSRLHEFNNNMDYVSAAMRAGCRFIFTSRNYIWSEAQANIKFAQIISLKSSQVAINLQELSAVEKAQILFNHLRSGNQSARWRLQFRSFMPQIVLDENFTPECARRLSRTEYTLGLKPNLVSLRRFVSEQGECLVESIRGLPKSHRGALAAVYMSGGALIGARKEHPSVQAAMDLYGLDLDELRISIAALKDVFVKQGATAEERGWIFKHPTIREAMANIVQSEPDLVEMAVRGNPLLRLLSESVCEGVSVRGAKFSIPESLFDVLVDRIKQEEPWTPYVIDFLTTRGSREFRVRFFSGRAHISDPLVAANTRPSDRSCEFFAVLQADGLLDATARETMTKALFEQANSYGCVDIPLACKSFLGDGGYRELIDSALETLITERAEIIQNYAECWERDVDPQSYFDSLTFKMNELARSVGFEFEDAWLDERYDEISEHMSYMEEEYTPDRDEDDDRRLSVPSQTDLETSTTLAEIQAIFSDVAA